MDVIARLDALERRVAELSRPLLHYERTEDVDPTMLDILRVQAFAGDIVASATVEIRGDIDQSLRERVEAELWAKHTARHLDIHIDSDGGDFDCSVALYRAIRFAPALTKTARMGRQCSSGALIIAMAGDLRIARADTEIVLHLVASSPPQNCRWTAAEHITAARLQSIMDRRMLSLMADRTGADFDALAAEASHERPSELAWCLKHGIVHEVAP